MTAKTRRLGVKFSAYVPADIKDSMEAEANRQDRSLSWLIRKSWEVALPTMQKFPKAE